MACSYPIRIKNPKFKNGGIKNWERKQYFYVPCGKCLSCMISKREWLDTACNYEFNKYGCGAFVTLTYDDEHILNLIDDDQYEPTLNYKDFQDFMKRLRRRLEYRYKVNCDFKYLAVGEYGGKFGRPHYHVLFFGLDCRNNELDFLESWQNGMIQSMPILPGGISYVLKYMDKDEKRNRENYNFQKSNEPFIKYSKGLGRGFIEEHLQEIKKNGGYYEKRPGRMKALPSYWLNKLGIILKTDLDPVREQMIQEHYRNSKNEEVKDKEKISRLEVRMWSMEKARKTEEKLIRQSREKQIPQNDFDEKRWRATMEDRWLDMTEGRLN